MHHSDRVIVAVRWLGVLASLLIVAMPAAAQVVFQDSLQLSAATYSGAEGAGTIAVTITRTGPGPTSVGVTLSTSNATAVAGQDYAPVSTSVSFTGGPLTIVQRTVNIPITNDAVLENNETFTVTLSSPTGGARLGAITTATVTITDDDPPASAPSFTIGSSAYPKQLQLNWSSVPGATFYRLWPAVGLSPPIATYPAQATSATLEVAVHRTDWPNTRYVLGACNAFGCAVSSPQGIAAEMLGAIGYFKASNTEPSVIYPLGADKFGTSVALSADGNTLAVGATLEDSDAHGVGGDQNNNNAATSGAVYVFTRAANGEWTQQTYLKTSNAASQDDYFGRTVALSGDGNVLAVGTERVDEVYVFTRSSGQWSGPTVVTPTTVDAGDGFGRALALSLDGLTLAVGAPQEDSDSQRIDTDSWDNSAPASGAAYVFTRSGTQWQQQAYVKASNAEAGDTFGTAVALGPDGATLAVGAPLEDSSATTIGGNQSLNNASASGAAYVFVRTGTSWQQQAYVKASNTEADDRFGTSVSLGRLGSAGANGSRLAVGAPGENSAATGVNGDQSDNSSCQAGARTAAAGAVYTYERSGTQWSQQAYVKASNTAPCLVWHVAAAFGTTLALSANGSTLAVGAPGESGTSAGVNGDQSLNAPWPPFGPRPGAAYVFSYGYQGAWSQVAYVKASNPEVGDSFANAIALSSTGYTLAVGAAQEDSNARGVDGDQNNNDAEVAGAVYLY